MNERYVAILTDGSEETDAMIGTMSEIAEANQKAREHTDGTYYWFVEREAK